MARTRVPKGQIFLKKDEKVLDVISQLSSGYSEHEFVLKFQEIYPIEWGKVIARWQAHERLTPPGKSHPMARPEQYMINTLRNVIRRQKKVSAQAIPELNTSEEPDL